MAKRKSTRPKALRELQDELEHIALTEEVREEFDALDERGVPLPEQALRATPPEIDQWKVRRFQSKLKQVPADVLDTRSGLPEVMFEDEPPGSGDRVPRASGMLASEVAQAERNSNRGATGAAEREQVEIKRLVEFNRLCLQRFVGGGKSLAVAIPILGHEAEIFQPSCNSLSILRPVLNVLQVELRG